MRSLSDCPPDDRRRDPSCCGVATYPRISLVLRSAQFLTRPAPASLIPGEIGLDPVVEGTDVWLRFYEARVWERSRSLLHGRCRSRRGHPARRLEVPGAARGGHDARLRPLRAEPEPQLADPPDGRAGGFCDSWTFLKRGVTSGGDWFVDGFSLSLIRRTPVSLGAGEGCTIAGFEGLSIARVLQRLEQL